MKFSDVESTSWEELRPYVDTCLLPVTGLTGSEQPWEATKALEMLRDVLDCFEIPYKGRVLTYPALHYIEGEEGRFLLEQVCERLKQSFPYVILVSASDELHELENLIKCDLVFVITPKQLAESLPGIKQKIADRLQALWSKR
ncbi:DUF2487 family protein [Paenibacillus sp. UNC451MF]|uniref:DUF2487 family protein n=1 Tax=Paenibacillus sp. UNC451MF TaxID=1449063 RepID=UPI00048F0FE4|nr:DUF2487 family protein [Paenibacillus sp. UNC451MF]